MFIKKTQHTSCDMKTPRAEHVGALKKREDCRKKTSNMGIMLHISAAACHIHPCIIKTPRDQLAQLSPCTSDHSYSSQPIPRDTFLPMDI